MLPLTPSSLSRVPPHGAAAPGHLETLALSLQLQDTALASSRGSVWVKRPVTNEPRAHPPFLSSTDWSQHHFLAQPQGAPFTKGRLEGSHREGRGRGQRKWAGQAGAGERKAGILQMCLNFMEVGAHEPHGQM